MKDYEQDEHIKNTVETNIKYYELLYKHHQNHWTYQEIVWNVIQILAAPLNILRNIVRYFTNVNNTSANITKQYELFYTP